MNGCNWDDNNRSAHHRLVSELCVANTVGLLRQESRNLSHQAQVCNKEGVAMDTTKDTKALGFIYYQKGVPKMKPISETQKKARSSVNK